MCRYRLLPSPAQEAVLRVHCGHARYVWNLAVEQHSHWHPGRKSAPGYLEQCRQLTAARAVQPWLAAGSQMVQQQALRDFARAMAFFFDPENPAGRPSWRKAGRDEGFRVVAVQPGHMNAPPAHIICLYLRYLNAYHRWTVTIPHVDILLCLKEEDSSCYTDWSSR